MIYDKFIKPVLTLFYRMNHSKHDDKFKIVSFHLFPNKIKIYIYGEQIFCHYAFSNSI